MKQERAVRTRQSLIRSAAESFERHGYVQARLADISTNAGVSLGALHFHFENKAAVAAAVETTAAASLRRAGRLAQRPGMNALQRLTRTSQALADQLHRDVVSRAGLRLSGDTARLSRVDLRQEWQACVRQLLTEARDERLLVEHVDLTAMVATIVAATTGFGLLGRKDPRWVSPASLAGFWRLVMPCLAAPAPAQALGEVVAIGARAGAPEHDFLAATG
ncbi:ScbR family autoregulator-binding transcription factor [Streptomyces sp. NPDC006632]|uniref:ScbR family autoregulator-binding transcription factor n=1 Tax=unclassified Streptomyces TaxID=2593676 RepID=UPI002E1A71FA